MQCCFWKLFEHSKPLSILRQRFLTILELDLYFQILPKQVHHHGLHVASDATAIPGRRVEKHCVWACSNKNAAIALIKRDAQICCPNTGIGRHSAYWRQYAKQWDNINCWQLFIWCLLVVSHCLKKKSSLSWQWCKMSYNNYLIYFLIFSIFAERIFLCVSI